MKKLTIKQFAQVIRDKNPKKYDDLSDNVLSYKHLKKFPLDAKYLQPEELVKLGIDVAKGTTDKVKNYLNDKIVDKLGGQSAVDSTIQKVKDKATDIVKDIKNKYKASGDRDTSTTTDTTTTTTNTPTKTDNSDKTIVTKYDPVTNKHKALNTKDCSSFPFEMGCINPRIGRLNQIFFGDPMDNIYDRNLFKSLYSDGYFAPGEEKEGKITQEIYNKAIQNSKEQNESINSKKIIKESVKKVLKDYIIKK